jgi:hypothetical protein
MDPANPAVNSITLDGISTARKNTLTDAAEFQN